MSPNIEWESSFGELGVEAKFLSFWDRITAYNFGIAPAVYIDISPVKPETENDDNFNRALVEKVADEIVKKVLGDEKKLEETILDFSGYDQEKQVLSLILVERDNDWTLPYRGKNDLPL